VAGADARRTVYGRYIAILFGTLVWPGACGREVCGSSARAAWAGPWLRSLSLAASACVRRALPASAVPAADLIYAASRLADGRWVVRVLSDDPYLPAVTVVAVVDCFTSPPTPDGVGRTGGPAMQKSSFAGDKP
jgi:hypothetical protein